MLVGLSGLEPPTSRLSGGRSNRLSYKPILVLAQFLSLFLQLRIPHYELRIVYGGDMRDRTADPLLAKQVLSQLSYTPISLRVACTLLYLDLNNDFFTFRNLTLD